MSTITNEENEIEGTLNGKYTIIKKLGSGKTAKAYLGYETKAERRELFAFKVIKSDMNESEYKNEECILSQINNDNVVKLSEGGKGTFKKTNGKCNDVSYLKIEYMEHGELFDFVYFPKKGFGENFGRLIMNSILAGLEGIHSKGIIHRDLKTENILVDSAFNVKIADLGFATYIEGNSGSGSHTNYLGTRAYAAPELLAQIPYYGQPSDIYSFGLMMFVLVTGTMPYQFASPNDPFYKFICINNYDAYWKFKRIKLSEDFMNLFNNLICYDPIQRLSLSEIKKSDWMAKGDYSAENYNILKEDLSKRLAIIKAKKH